jgi:hypothetical protein
VGEPAEPKGLCLDRDMGTRLWLGGWDNCGKVQGPVMPCVWKCIFRGGKVVTVVLGLYLGRSWSLAFAVPSWGLDCCFLHPHNSGVMLCSYCGSIGRNMQVGAYNWSDRDLRRVQLCGFFCFDGGSGLSILLAPQSILQ